MRMPTRPRMTLRPRLVRTTSPRLTAPRPPRRTGIRPNRTRLPRTLLLGGRGLRRRGLRANPRRARLTRTRLGSTRRPIRTRPSRRTRLPRRRPAPTRTRRRRTHRPGRRTTVPRLHATRRAHGTRRTTCTRLTLRATPHRTRRTGRLRRALPNPTGCPDLIGGPSTTRCLTGGIRRLLRARPVARRSLRSRARPRRAPRITMRRRIRIRTPSRRPLAPTGHTREADHRANRPPGRVRGLRHSGDGQRPRGRPPDRGTRDPDDPPPHHRGLAHGTELAVQLLARLHAPLRVSRPGQRALNRDPQPHTLRRPAFGTHRGRVGHRVCRTGRPGSAGQPVHA